MNDFIPISQPSITEKEIAYVTEAVRSTWISSLGPYIDDFEAGFAKFCGTRYAVSVMNGTVAIQLALHALGIGEGDEVIVPDLSFVATANAVLYVGATPVFADVDPKTYCLDPATIEALITPRTKAILPVHLYGHPAPMTEINRIAKAHGLFCIEDAAEAHGATIDGRTVGGLSDIATFSFYGNKNLTTGEGGMLTTNSEALYDQCRYLRDHAMSKAKRYWHTEMGFNFRITNLQAAVGCAQLERAPEIFERRRAAFELYAHEMRDCDRVVLNQTEPWATNAYWMVCARMPGYTEADRDALVIRLKEHGIDSRPFFYPMSDMPYMRTDTPNTVTRTVSREGINLPLFYDLTDAQIRRICATLKTLV